MKILVVEDEPDMREMLTYGLAGEPFDVVAVGDGRSAWKKLAEEPVDLVLLDWMLPDISGIELLGQIRGRSETQEIPVILLTARDAENDRVRGLDSGADDYMIKPFSMAELKARIRSHLRRRDGGKAQLVRVGELVIEVDNFRAHVNHKQVVLGPTEFRLLAHLASHPERLYSRSQLLDAVWGVNVFVEERTVDVHIRRLRKALEPFSLAHLVQTVRGAGYRFVAPVQPGNA